MTHGLKQELRRVAAHVMVLAFFAGAVGCGVARQATMGTTPAPLDAIDDLEANITQQQGVMSGGGECHDRCRAADSICDSASRICQIASDLAELEALESCRRAETTCTNARNHVAGACACP